MHGKCVCLFIVSKLLEALVKMGSRDETTINNTKILFCY